MRKGSLVQRTEKSETSSLDKMKSKDIMRKVEIMRRKKLFQQKVSSAPGMSNVFEAKLRMLRKNNRCLAKALSEQKMEANHWYTQNIELKGELQEANEKLLRMPLNNTNIEHVFMEAEKQIKECYKSIDKDFNTALERIVEAVEKLTKAKQLVGSTLNILQLPSQTPLNTSSRLLGSRTPLGASGVGPLRQRAVLPMVSGHVLQPVMVPLPKLKIRLSEGRRDSVQGHEENDMDMSTIGEQPLLENSDVSEGQLFHDIEEQQHWSNIELAADDDTLGAQSQSGLDTANLRVRLEKDTLRSSTRLKAESPGKQQTTSPRRQGVSKRGGGRGVGRREDCRASKLCPGQVSVPLAGENEVIAPAPDEDDPLEGPSWLPDIGNLRGAFRGHYRGRRRRIINQRDVVKAEEASALNSSDKAVEATVGVSEELRPVIMQESSPRRESASPTVSAMDSQSQSFDQSCLDSPTSLFARMELLEAQRGRKSKRFLKNKLNRAKSDSELQTDASHLSLEENEQGVKGSPKKIPTLLVSCSKEAGVSLMIENKEGSCKTSPALLNESIQEPRVADQTCPVVTNMDITQPVSGTIIQENVISTVITRECLEDEHKPSQSKRRFFKTKDHESIDEIPKAVERTPFDLSMLNETVVNMPPFSSMRTTEKENLQPLSCEGEDEPITLCDVSVVLKDVIKESMDSDTPRRSVRGRQKRSQSPICTSLNSPRRPRRVSRMLQYQVNYNEDSDEMWSPKWAEETRRKKGKRESPTAEGTSGDSTSNLELKKMKKRTPKLLSNNLDNTQREAEEPAAVDAHILSTKTENTEILPNCYVKIQRTSLMETPSSKTDDKGIEDLLSSSDGLPNLQHLPSESQNGLGTEMKTAPVANENSTNDCTSSSVNAERYTIHVEEYDQDDKAGKGIDEPGMKSCIDYHIQQDEKELWDMQQICQTEGTQKHNGKKHSGTVNALTLAEGVGCHDAREKTSTTSPRESGRDTGDDTSAKTISGVQTNIENVEDPLIEDHSRKRRAATRVASYRELSLNSKMRRGKNNVISISTSETKDKNSKMRCEENDEISISASEARDKKRSRGMGRKRGKRKQTVVKNEMS